MSYTDAVEKASLYDGSFVADTAICTVVYETDITKGTLMPYYEFHWKDGEETKSFSIPL